MLSSAPSLIMLIEYKSTFRPKNGRKRPLKECLCAVLNAYWALRTEKKNLSIPKMSTDQSKWRQNESPHVWHETFSLCSSEISDPCRSYRILPGATTRRVTSSRAGRRSACDNRLPMKWYRMPGRGSPKMPETCVAKRKCGTHAPGWLHGGHPIKIGSTVRREVCFHWKANCCQWMRSIRVKNCGSFFVYELKRTPACNLRYCKVDNGECSISQWRFEDVFRDFHGTKLIPRKYVLTSLPLVSVGRHGRVTQWKSG